MMQQRMPCLVKDCQNSGTGMITIVAKKIKKGFDAPEMKGYTLCTRHINWLKKMRQVIIEDY